MYQDAALRKSIQILELSNLREEITGTLRDSEDEHSICSGDVDMNYVPDGTYLQEHEDAPEGTYDIQENLVNPDGPLMDSMAEDDSKLPSLDNWEEAVFAPTDLGALELEDVAKAMNEFFL